MITPIEANYPTSSGGVDTRLLHFARPAFENRVKLGLRSELGQGYGIVIQGMIMARHIFRGLKRGVHDGSSEDQGPNKLVYSWRPQWDCIWMGDKFGGRIERLNAPKDKVFVVIVTPNTGVDVGTPAGWVNRWSWINEDSELEGAPVDWQDRYELKIWSR